MAATLWAVLCLMVLPAVRAKLVFYVAPTGSDAADGTLTHPFASLRRAQAAVRAVRGQGTDVDVVLRAGRYDLDGPLVFGVEDGGLPGRTVMWRAYPGERVVVSGGRKVEGWRLADPQRDIWMARVPGDWRTRQLYVDGVRANRTAAPWEALFANATVHPGWGYRVPGPVAARWRNAAQVELVYTQSFAQWSEPRCPLAAAVAGAGGSVEVVVRQPCYRNVMAGAAGRPVLPKTVENVFELLPLAPPGSWYHDVATATLYYRAAPAQSMASINVMWPLLETIVTVAAPPEPFPPAPVPAPAPVSGIGFSGLTFAFCTWLQPSSSFGFAEAQAAFTETRSDSREPHAQYTRAPAAVELRRVSGLTVRGCVFAHVGATGLYVGAGSQGVVMEGNVFADCSAGAVQLGDVWDYAEADPARHSAHHRFANNVVRDVGREYRGAVAVWAGHVRNVSLVHNDVGPGVPYSAMTLGWGWGREASYAANNSVAYNRVSHFMGALGDGGGLYTNSDLGHTDVHHNYFSDQISRNPTGTFYADTGTAHVRYHANVHQRVPRWLGVNGGRGVHVHDCYTDQPLSDFICTADCRVRDVVVVAGGEWPAEARAVMAAAGLEPQFRGLRKRPLL